MTAPLSPCRQWCNPWMNLPDFPPLLTTAHKAPTQRFVRWGGISWAIAIKPHTAAHTPKHGVLALLSTSFFLCVLLPCPYRPCLRKSQKFSHRATVGAAKFAAAVNVEDNKTSNPNPVLYNDVTRPIAQKPSKNDGIPSKALVFRFLGPHCGTM